MSWTWEIKTRCFLANCFHSSPCTCWEEHISDARTEMEAAPSGCMFVLGCLIPCVTCLCQLHLPLQLRPVSSTVDLHCLNQTRGMGRHCSSQPWWLGNNGRRSQTSGLTSSADVVPLHSGLQCFGTMFPPSPIF